MLLVTCRMALYTVSDILHCRKLNILNLHIDLRFRHQTVWREAYGQDPCSCLKNSVVYHNCFALPGRPVSDARATFVLPEYLKMALSKCLQHFELRICDKCNWHTVHDEEHIIVDKCNWHTVPMKIWCNCAAKFSNSSLLPRKIALLA
jgi:hypothetical protein